MSNYQQRAPQLGLKCFFFHFHKFASLVFLDITQNCSLGQCLTSSGAETFKRKIRNEFFQRFLLLLKKKCLIKLIFHISWLHKIYLTYNPTALFFRHKIVEWPKIEFKMRPMLFKKSWNLSYSNVVGPPVKLPCFAWHIYCYINYSIFLNVNSSYSLL